jgi:serine/threonine protein kinase
VSAYYSIIYNIVRFKGDARKRNIELLFNQNNDLKQLDFPELSYLINRGGLDAMTAEQRQTIRDLHFHLLMKEIEKTNGPTKRGHVITLALTDAYVDKLTFEQLGNLIASGAIDMVHNDAGHYQAALIIYSLYTYQFIQQINSGLKTSNKTEREKFRDTLFQEKHFYLALTASEILRVLDYCKLELLQEQRELLLTLFSRFPDSTRNQAALQHYLGTNNESNDNHNNNEPDKEIKEYLSAATNILLDDTYKDSSTLNTDERNAVRALANNQLNERIFFLINNKVSEKELNQNEIKLITHWKTLDRNQKPFLRELLTSVKNSAKTFIPLNPIFLLNRPEPESEKSQVLQSSSNSYKIYNEKPLGKGALGEVSLGYDMMTQEKVVIKKFTYNSKRMSDQAAAQEAGYRLRHLGMFKDEIVIPNTMKENGSNTDHYIIMKYIPGYNFKKVLFHEDKDNPNVTKNPLAFSQQLVYARSLLEEMKSFHDQGYIVDDPKTENCIADNCNVKFIDLDTTKHKDDKTPGSVMRTLGYTPPELLNNVPEPTVATNVYAAGAMLGDIFTSHGYSKNDVPRNLSTQVKQYQREHINFRSKAAIQSICIAMTQNEPGQRITLDVALIRLKETEIAYKATFQNHFTSNLSIEDIRKSIKEHNHPEYLVLIYKRLLELNRICQPGTPHTDESEELLTLLRDEMLRSFYSQAQKLAGEGKRVYFQDFKLAIESINEHAKKRGYADDLGQLLQHNINVRYDKIMGKTETETHRRFTNILHKDAVASDENINFMNRARKK